MFDSIGMVRFKIERQVLFYLLLINNIILLQRSLL